MALCFVYLCLWDYSHFYRGLMVVRKHLYQLLAFFLLFHFWLLSESRGNVNSLPCLLIRRKGLPKSTRSNFCMRWTQEVDINAYEIPYGRDKNKSSLSQHIRIKHGAVVDSDLLEIAWVGIRLKSSTATATATATGRMYNCVTMSCKGRTS